MNVYAYNPFTGNPLNPTLPFFLGDPTVRINIDGSHGGGHGSGGETGAQTSSQNGAQSQGSNVVGTGNASNTGTVSFLDTSNKQVSSGANGNNSGTIANYGANAHVEGLDSSGVKSIFDSVFNSLAKIFSPPSPNTLSGSASGGATEGTISTLPLPTSPVLNAGTDAAGSTKKWYQKILDLPTWQLLAAVAAVLVAVNLIFLKKKRA
jgi:hypothetical protein